MSNHRKQGKRGYRLHDERIAYSGGGGSMRSIKYELVGADKQTVIDAVVHDNKCLYGALNLNDYLREPDAPNLLDFWLTALSLGFVFSNQNSIEREFKNYLGQQTIEQEIFNALPENLRMNLDQAKFVDFLFKSQRSVESKTDEKRQKIVLDLLVKDGDDSELKPIAEKWSREFRPELEQLAFKSELFGIEKPELPERKLSLSFALDPNFEMMETADRTKFLDEIIDLYKKKCGEAQAKKFLCVGDNGNYFNGLFGNLYENLRGGKVDEIAEFLNEVYELDNLNEIKKRLNLLKNLADKIDEPKLVSKWSDYRSDFNGTIESWYSNRESKQNSTIEQLKTRRELLGEIYDALPETCEIRDGILRETIEFIDTASEKIDRTFTNELECYLATLRGDLNEYAQQNKETNLPKDWQKNLSKHIQSSPLFFGENKLVLWEQLKNLKTLIRQEIEKLEEILRGQFDDYEITDKQVDALAVLYNRIKGDGNREVIAALENIAKKLGVNFADAAPNPKTNRRQTRFFQTAGKYENEKIKVLPIPNKIMISELRDLAKLSELYARVKTAPQDDFNLRDVAQLSKVVASAVVYAGGKDIQRRVVLCHSNLSGFASLLSKGEFIARYLVQAVNGAQNLLAHNDDGRYFYKFDDKKFAHIEKRSVIFAKQGNNFSVGSDVWTKQLQDVPVLAVQSSRYQIQFLDWFFGKHAQKKSWLSAGGSFTIAEKTCQIDWSGDEPKIIDQQNDRLFVSQPFTINPPENRLFDAEKIKNRYIGIDIGEYGLAWSLIEVQDNEVKQLESGFIADNQQQTLKKDVKNLRERQVRATFTSPDTKIARVRESLIGSYRNLLEDLAMRKNARLSFEYEVSGFETGGNKISKVYDSIKRGSVARSENNAENKQAWGKLKNDEFVWKALETTAANTSRFCTKCRRVATEFWDKESEKFSDFYHHFRPDLGDGKQRQAAEEKLGKETIDMLRASNPSSIALFICPSPACDQVCDADKQAAFNIAIRGYLKDKSKTDKDFCARLADEYRDEKGKPIVKLENGFVKEGLTKEILVSEEAKLSFEPINLVET